MDNTQNSQPKVTCPECDTPLTLPQELTTGKITECPACGVECEIVSLDPLKLAPLEEEK